MKISEKAKTVIAVVIAIGVVIGAVGFAYWYEVTQDGPKGSNAGPATVTVTVTAPPARVTHWEEDSLPDEMYRWLDAHPGADLRPLASTDPGAAGHAECWAAVADVATLVMCPDGYTATSAVPVATPAVDTAPVAVVPVSKPAHKPVATPAVPVTPAPVAAVPAPVAEPAGDPVVAGPCPSGMAQAEDLTCVPANYWDDPAPCPSGMTQAEDLTCVPDSFYTDDDQPVQPVVNPDGTPINPPYTVAG